MNLSARQKATLREVGRIANELALRHDARRAARVTQLDYIGTLQKQAEHLPRTRDAHLAAAATEAQYEVLRERFDADAQRIAAELSDARTELEQLQEQLGEITRTIGPLHELISRILSTANLTHAGAGLDFGADAHEAVGRITLGAR